METIISNCIFGYQCEKSWQDLITNEDPSVKHCDKCDKNVYLCSNPQELMKAVRKGLCVAVETLENESNKFTLGYPSSANFSSFSIVDET